MNLLWRSVRQPVAARITVSVIGIRIWQHSGAISKTRQVFESSGGIPIRLYGVGLQEVKAVAVSGHCVTPAVPSPPAKAPIVQKV